MGFVVLGRAAVLNTGVTEHDFSVIRSVGFVLAVLFAVGLQSIRPHARLRGSWQTNCGLWAINLAVLGTVCGACACTVARWAEIRELGLFSVARLPRWMAVAGSVVALDLVSYCWHRANHLIPFLWRFHRVHHSDIAFTVSTGARFHPGELVLSLPLRLAAVVLLGAPPEGVLLFELVFNTANLVEHGNTNFPVAVEGAVARVLITPALHRFHHSRHWANLNTNFGTIFAVWDHVFGTYRANSSSTEVQTGLPGVNKPTGFRDVLLLPALR
jgi:sterol desaturase/sphingolipid hydroxylase (fatty acid hydroxylase superfamily)